jgi:hypothetical protein
MLTGQRALYFRRQLPYQVVAIKNAKFMNKKEEVTSVAKSLSVVEVNRIVNPSIQKSK